MEVEAVEVTPMVWRVWEEWEGRGWGGVFFSRSEGGRGSNKKITHKISVPVFLSSPPLLPLLPLSFHGSTRLGLGTPPTSGSGHAASGLHVRARVSRRSSAERAVPVRPQAPLPAEPASAAWAGSAVRTRAGTPRSMDQRSRI